MSPKQFTSSLYKGKRGDSVGNQNLQQRESGKRETRGQGGVLQPGRNRRYLGVGQGMGQSTAPGPQCQAQSRYILGCVALGKSAQPLWARPAPQGSYFSTGGSTQGDLAEVTRSHKHTNGRAGEWVQGQQTGALAVSGLRCAACVGP